jgi:hypothetical protein
LSDIWTAAARSGRRNLVGHRTLIAWRAGGVSEEFL